MRGGRSLGVEAAGRIRAVTAVALNATCFSLCALVTCCDSGCFIAATAATQLQAPLLEAAEPAVECCVDVCGRDVVLFEPVLRVSCISISVSYTHLTLPTILRV